MLYSLTQKSLETSLALVYLINIIDMEKNRFCAQIEPSLCSDFIFSKIDSYGDTNVIPSFRKMRDVTILLNDRLTSQFDPIRLKQATTPQRSDDSLYQSMSDDQKFDAIKKGLVCWSFRHPIIIKN